MLSGDFYQGRHVRSLASLSHRMCKPQFHSINKTHYLHPSKSTMVSMKKIFTVLLALTLLLTLSDSAMAQITCTPSGNLFVYTNYDGGVLNIDVNVNIPNIKIGICTYEPTTINITGAYVANVTEVRYAGYVSTTNHHCNNSPSTTTITGVSPTITSVNFLPPSTLSNPNGYSSIVCAYSCDIGTNQGGCNTADQIKDYFQSTTGGVLTSYFTQYGCWSTQPYQLAAGGNCCSTVLPCNIVANAGIDQQICANDSATLIGSATGGATTYTWTPTTGLGSPNAPTTTATPSVTTAYILTASDGGNCSDQDTIVVTVNQLPTVGVSPEGPFCENDPSANLQSGTPSGGSYAGTGVSSGVFDPGAAGAGSHLLTYVFTDPQGCTDSASTSITVTPNPGTPTVTFAPPTLSTAGPADSVQWFLNGQYLFTNGLSFNPNQMGMYSAVVWVGGCASDTSAEAMVEITGAPTAGPGIVFSATPNPSAGSSLRLSASLDISFEALVYDALGKIVIPTTMIHQSGLLQVSNLGKGIYFIRISCEGQHQVLRIVRD